MALKRWVPRTGHNRATEPAGGAKKLVIVKNEPVIAKKPVMADFGKSHLHGFNPETGVHSITPACGGPFLNLRIFGSGERRFMPFAVEGVRENLTRGVVRDLLNAGEQLARANHVPECRITTDNPVVIGACKKSGWEETSSSGPVASLRKKPEQAQEGQVLNKQKP